MLQLLRIIWVYFNWISPRTLYERIVQAVKNAGVTTEQVQQCEKGGSMVASSVSSILRWWSCAMYIMLEVHRTFIIQNIIEDSTLPSPKLISRVLASFNESQCMPGKF